MKSQNTFMRTEKLMSISIFLNLNRILLSKLIRYQVNNFLIFNKWILWLKTGNNIDPKATVRGIKNYQNTFERSKSSITETERVTVKKKLLK